MMSPLCIAVLQTLEMEDGNTNINFILFQASLLSFCPSLHIIFADSKLQIQTNTLFPHHCFPEPTSPRERSHTAYSWLCSHGLGHPGGVYSSPLNSARACLLGLRPAGITWPCPDYHWCVSNPHPSTIPVPYWRTPLLLSPPGTWTDQVRPSAGSLHPC